MVLLYIFVSKLNHCFYIIAPGVTLHHMNSAINHGSVISIESIGEGDDALICRTINQQCCRGTTKRGEWYYPSNAKVPTMGENQRFYRNRSNDGEVILNQRQNRALTSPGLYCCVIPDSTVFCGIYQRICVNLGRFAELH